jgi:hypothetical protein
MQTHTGESLVLERTRIDGVNAYVTLILNGGVDVGEIQFGKPSQKQQELGIYSNEQIKRILYRRGYSFA